MNESRIKRDIKGLHRVPMTLLILELTARLKEVHTSCLAEELAALGRDPVATLHTLVWAAAAQATYIADLDDLDDVCADCRAGEGDGRPPEVQGTRPVAAETSTPI